MANDPNFERGIVKSLLSELIQDIARIEAYAEVQGFDKLAEGMKEMRKTAGDWYHSAEVKDQNVRIKKT